MVGEGPRGLDHDSGTARSLGRISIRRDLVNFMLWRITPGQSGGQTGQEVLEGRETVSAQSWGMKRWQSARGPGRSPVVMLSPVLSSGEAARPVSFTWKCLSCRIQLLQLLDNIRSSHVARDGMIVTVRSRAKMTL